MILHSQSSTPISTSQDESLDALGVVYAVQIAIYVPVMFFALRICSRYGVRERGWLLLLIFSLIRIVSGALLVAAEQPPWLVGWYNSYDIYQAGIILDASGISFLLLSTLGLIEIITEAPSGERKHWHTFVFRILHIVGIVALVLTIIGNAPNSWMGYVTVTMGYVYVSLVAGLFIVLVAVTVLQWASRYRPMKYRKQLLVAVSVALPFLAVCTLYDVLSNLSSLNIAVPVGEWQVYVVMDVVMEYAVVVIYALAGTVLRLDEESDIYPLYH